ncbi:MAG: acyl-CoA dehydrogenase family protein, partial [Chitinophagales bacterium]
MANQYIDLNTLRFQLYDVHQVEKLLSYERFQDHDRQSMDIFLDAVKDFSDKEAFPYFREMDEKPVVYKDGKVMVHPQIETIMKKCGEMGLIGADFDYDEGGVQLPGTVSNAAYFILDAANNNISGYPGLTLGAAKLILSYGSDSLKEKYVPNMLSGKWGGTMCLTEPQAGSSLSDITTSASPNEDGSYKIKGQKIFISGGDNQFTENFVHLVLARIEGAPAGTKGISLFVVPKKRLLEDNSLESNDVLTAGDFQKLGQRGYATVHLVFGENDNCNGWLIGEAHKGLKCMFQMMNGARISVGRHGAGIATAAYHASLQYAQERPQGRPLSNGGKKDLTQGQTLIIKHPDVRRMLMLQKAVSEACLSIVLQSSIYHDLETVSEGADKAHYNLLLEMLTPITKTYPSEMGRVSVNNGVQVLGGYGFCSEFVLQQYYRDIRIMAIYEGTTGIQSLDLLGRKVVGQNGKGLKVFSKEIQATIEAASNFDDLKPYGDVLIEKLQVNQKILGFLVPFA